MLPFILATIQHLNLTADYLLRVPVGCASSAPGQTEDGIKSPTDLLSQTPVLLCSITAMMMSAPGPYFALIHPSAWNKNSTKFAVTSDSSTQRKSLGKRPCCTRLGSKRPDLVAVVAPMCIKELRLATAQLPEKSWPIGSGRRRTSR